VEIHKVACRSSVGIKADWEAEVRFLSEERVFSLLHSV
jgi:hypothetical protein